MFSKVATENLLSEQPKFKKNKTKKQLPCPGQVLHLWQSHPTFSSPLLGAGVQPNKEIKLYDYIFFGKYSTITTR